MVQNFGQLFSIFYFLLFEKKKNKKKHDTYLNNQNQEAFTVIIINYKNYK